MRHPISTDIHGISAVAAYTDYRLSPIGGNMKILVACEESQAVTKEFRRLGHEAYSCDILPCSGGYPEWHLQQDVTELLQQEWNMIIAFPPCTDLAVSGAAWFEQKRKDGRQKASIDFFMLFANAECEKICIENPIGIMSTTWRKPDQIVQPWMFGHPESKATCFWLKGLPLLKETENVKLVFDTLPKNKQQRLHYLPPSKDRAMLRSKTFPGIARAMAEQWGGEQQVQPDNSPKMCEECGKYPADLPSNLCCGCGAYKEHLS